MNVFYKNRLVFWMLIVLVIINISALISFLLFPKEQAPASCCSTEEQQCNVFRDELDLSAAQDLKVRAINQNYMASAGPVALSIKEARASILTELDRDQPDTVRLNELTSQLAGLQMKIQKENNKQYSELRRVCTPGQAQKLSALYRDLYGCPMQGGQGKHRYRHGQQRSGTCE